MSLSDLNGLSLEIERRKQEIRDSGMVNVHTVETSDGSTQHCFKKPKDLLKWLSETCLEDVECLDKDMSPVFFDRSDHSFDLTVRTFKIDQAEYDKYSDHWIWG